MIINKLKYILRYCLVSAVIFMSACIVNGGSRTSTNAVPNDITQTPRVLLGQVATIPLSNLAKPTFTYLPLVNNHTDTLFLTALYIKKAQDKLELVKGNDLFDARDCNILKPNGTCKIKISPRQPDSYMLIVAFKDSKGKEYNSRHLINISNHTISSNGFIYFNDNPSILLTKNEKSALAIPFILDNDYSKLSAKLSDSQLPLNIICPTVDNTVNKTYAKGSLCTALIGIPNKIYGRLEPNQLTITGTLADANTSKLHQPNQSITLNFSIVNNTLANIVTSAINVVINPANGSAGNAQTVTLFNDTGTTQATNIAINLPYPLAISNNTCGTTLNVNTSCTFSVNVVTGLTTSGQTSMTISYTNGSTTQLITFNVIYITSTPSAAMTIQTNSNLLNVQVNTTQYIPVTITNSGNVTLTNLQFNSIHGQSSSMNYGVTGSSCALGQSLSVNASCVVVIGYNPAATQAVSNVKVIPTVSYSYNGQNVSYNSASLTIPYSAVNTNNFIIAGDYGAVTSATALASWTQRFAPPFATNATIANAAYGSGSFFIIGNSDGKIYYTSDSNLILNGGVFWLADSMSPGSTAITSISYDSTSSLYFVTGGASARTIMTSPDVTSTAWTTRVTVAGAGSVVNSIFINGAGVFIAPATTTANLYTSNNGTVWAQQTGTAIAGKSYYTSTAFPSFYYAFGAAGVSATSATPTVVGSWTANPVISSTFTARGSAVYNQSLVIVVGSGDSNNIYTTTNPATVAWTQQASTSTQLNSVVYSPSLFLNIAVGNSGLIFYSSNGINWTSTPSNTSQNLMNVYCSFFVPNTPCIAVGAAIILYSYDGINWVRPTIKSLSYNNTNFVAVTNSGSIYTSTNLTSWSRQSTPITKTAFNRVNCIRSDLCIAVGNSGSIITSGDTSNWTQQNSNTSNNLNGFGCGLSNCVIVGNSGTILYSTTLTNLGSWTVASSPTGNQLNGVSYLLPITGGYYGGLYVAVGASGTIITSSDGITWTSRTSGTANNLNSVVCGYNSSFGCVAVGSNGTILTSPDGITWTSRTSGTTNKLNDIALYNGSYTVAGDSGTLLTSTNSTTWTTQTTGIGATTAINLNAAFSY